jgi:hypothetical protein
MNMEENMEQEPVKPVRNVGGRPPLPDAPTNAEECRSLLAKEVIKTAPHTPRLKGLQTLLESFERREPIATLAAQLAQSQSDNTALQADLISLRESLSASQENCATLAVPHDAVEDTKRACDALRIDIARAQADREAAIKAKDAGIKARDAAVDAQRAAEQGERQVREHLTAAYMKLIGPLESALKLFMSSTSVDAREHWYRLNQLADDFKRGLAQAIAKPVLFSPAPVNIVRRATAEELDKAREALIEKARLENAAQPRSIDPSAYEPMRERAVPRAAEPESQKPISGGADFAEWVK